MCSEIGENKRAQFSKIIKIKCSNNYNVGQLIVSFVQLPARVLKNMTLIEFLLLGEDEQLEELYKDGVFVGKLVTDTKSTILYQLDAFYVEITFRSYRKYISKVKCFKSPENLLPYIDQVELSDLIKCEK